MAFMARERWSRGCHDRSSPQSNCRGRVLSALLCLLAVAGCFYTLGAILALARYARQVHAMPLLFPPVTVLKPLHGEEPRLFENLSSFVTQDYPGAVEFVFGVKDRGDPAVAVFNRLSAAFPHANLRLVVDSRHHGRNGKVSNLINMSRAITGEVVVLADSDMLVEPDYLTRVVGALQTPGIGGVTCLYRGISLPNVWSRLATSWVDGQFLPNVVFGVTLGMAKPCFGSTIALRRDTLDDIGGFATFKDHLADDYEMGAAIRRLGFKIAVPARPVIGHTSSSTGFRALVQQELRWARTIKAVDLVGFAGSIVTHVLPLALLAVLADRFSPGALILLAVALTLRCALLLQIKSFVQKDTAELYLLPLRDLLSFAVFFVSFLPGSIEWRGHRFGVRSDGILTSPDSTG